MRSFICYRAPAPSSHLPLLFDLFFPFFIPFSPPFHFPIRIAGDQFRIVLILHAVGIELILTGGADAGIRCDAQFSCDELIVCRDDYDALLFQRKVSVGLLFRHILTSLQQHTLPHQGRNSYDQNGEKSSVKCEICTKLDSDPTRDFLISVSENPTVRSAFRS